MGSHHLPVISIFILLVNIANSQLIETKLLPDDAHPNHSFGFSVAMDSVHAVIGAYIDTIDGAYSGSAYVFKRNGLIWEQERKIVPDIIEDHGEFGFSVAVKGNDILIGKREDTEKGSWSGAVYWYQYNDGSTWIKKKKIMASDEQIGDYFGTSIAISGEYAIIGATGVNGETNNDGAAYIFQKKDSSWEEKYKIIPDSLVGEAYFGHAVDIDGDWAIIGAYSDDELERDAGAAYLYQRIDTSWVFNKKLRRSDTDNGHDFGYSVAISGEYAAVGEISVSGYAGFVYVYKYDSGENTWHECACLTDTSVDYAIYYGYSISLDGDYLAVGVPEDETIGNRAGALFLYKRIEDDWVLLKKVYASDGGETDYLGRSTFLYGDYVICGVPRYAIGDTISSGIAYLYSGISELTDINQLSLLAPGEFYLDQNYPNPFNAITVIRYTVGAQNLVPLQHVHLSIYNILGQKVATLVNKKQPAGDYKVEWDASGFASGVYLYRLQAGDHVQTKKMIYMK